MKFFLTLFCLSFFISVQASDYFIRLSDSGIKQRDKLVQSFISSKNALNNARPDQASRLFLKTLIPENSKTNSFGRWLTLAGSSQEALQLIDSLQSMGLVEYFEPVGRFKIEPTTSDSLSGEQWYLSKIGIEKAWQISRGEPNIIVGVIDTGIDYTHPDLSTALWINEAEAAGQPGVDDDNNGYVDDFRGWDFTDAERFADGGDYRDPDNDPMDEFGNGHGTQIAGLIAAEADNGIGISGIAPGLKVMNLRAGTASGYLEEDDVARAIIYAIENGARVLNMSFGDVVVSRLLRDVIYYAYQNDVIIIASSGNSGTGELHYPSGLAETISVGASTENDNLAGFSSFGPTLDLVAPGTNMISTAVGGSYNSVNGTSFSAPVVAAIAGLLLSKNPDYSAERIRNILKTSAEDILQYGWDNYSAAGRVSAAQAMATANGGILSLYEPKANTSTAAGRVWITGSIVHPDIRNARLDYGLGDNPESWINLEVFENRQVFKDSLALLETENLSDTLVTIRLKITLLDGTTDETRTVLAIDRTNPLISDVEIIPVYDGARNSKLVFFNSDDICRARLYLYNEADSQLPVIYELNYETSFHRFNLPPGLADGRYRMEIEAENYSGLISRDDNNGNGFLVEINNRADWDEFVQVDRSLPAGYFINRTFDLDTDGNREVILSLYGEDGNFGPVQIYEWEGGQFFKRLETAFTAIPRDAGDVDNDGKSDMLIGYGQQSFLVEANSPGSFPARLIWADTVNFWAAGYFDSDNDQKNEIIGRVDSQYVVLESNGDNTFTETARLENTSAGANQFGVPKVISIDLNGNGTREIVFGDYDGDIQVYQAEADNRYELLYGASALQKDATSVIDGLEVGDQQAQLWVATHTSDDLNSENEFDARYWSLQQFSASTSLEQLLSKDTLNIFGYQSLKEFDSSIRLAQFDGEVCLFASVYPDFYVFRFDDQSGKARPVWHQSDGNSNAILVEDFDRDGYNEFYYNNGQNIIGYSRRESSAPHAPYPFEAFPLDSNRVQLKWGGVGGSVNYQIYRGSTMDKLVRMDQTGETSYIDSMSVNEQKYFYAVTAVDSAFPVPESRFSVIDSARTSYPPRVESAEVLNQRQLKITFNEKVQFSGQQPFDIRLESLKQQATSALILKNQQQILVGFEGPFRETHEEIVIVKNVFDLDGVPIDSNKNHAVFIYEEDLGEPYLEKAELVDRYKMKLYFSETMNRDDLLDTDNYTIEPQGRVASVTVMDDYDSSVEIIFSRNTLSGGLGVASYLVLNNIHSAGGSELSETNKISLFSAVNGLGDLIIYPQPLRPADDILTFANVPANVEIKIYTINGKLLKELDTAEYGGVHWNVKDQNGQRVGSGVYLYEIIHETNKKYGKLVIVR